MRVIFSLSNKVDICKSYCRLFENGNLGSQVGLLGLGTADPGAASGWRLQLGLGAAVTWGGALRRASDQADNSEI